MKDYCRDVVHGLRHKDFKKLQEALSKLEEENSAELKLAKEFKVTFLLNLHSMIEEETRKIKNTLNKRGECIKHVKRILHSLKKVVDQRKIRDQLIKEVIHPLFKKLGYKKKARSFVKDNKKVNVYTSQFCDYYDVKFIFEITIEGTKYENHRVKEKWFELTQDTKLNYIKEEIQKHLIKEIIPFINRF